ncbi:MAG: tetratricopeptide repeat protein [Candidatus Binataceae bacterium]
MCGSAQAGGAQPIVLAHLEEESIPAADLTVTPTPTPTPEAGGSTTPTATPSESPSETPSPTPYPEQTGALIFPEPTPLPTSSDELPPLEAGTITPTLRISDSSLQAAIDQEQSPGRAASMRIAEEARVELLDGHPDEAIRDLGRAVSIDPSDPYAYFYLGRAYIAKQNYLQAMTFLKRAEIGFGSGNAVWLGETLAFEGLNYEESGHEVAAAAAYQQALQVNPGNLMARVGYTRLSSDLTPSTPEAAPSVNIDAPPPAMGSPPPPPIEPPPPPPPNESPAPTN